MNKIKEDSPELKLEKRQKVIQISGICLFLIVNIFFVDSLYFSIGDLKYALAGGIGSFGAWKVYKIIVWRTSKSI